MDRETHIGMVVKPRRNMGRVFLACCHWCLQGDKTDGGMAASAAQLTLGVWGLCMYMCFFLHQGGHHVTLQRSSTGRNRSVCRGSSILPLSAAVSSYSLEKGSAGTRGSMFMMRFLWLRELKLRLWPNWTLKTQTTTIRYAVHYFPVWCMMNLLQMLSHFLKLLFRFSGTISSGLFWR